MKERIILILNTVKWTKKKKTRRKERRAHRMSSAFWNEKS